MQRLLRSAVASSLALCGLALPAAAHYAFYFTANGDGAQVVPPTGSTANVNARFVFDGITYEITYDIVVTGLQGAQTDTQLCGFANAGVNAPTIHSLPIGTHISGTVQSTQSDLTNWLNNQAYVSIPTSLFPSGEIRAQILFTNTPNPVDFCLGEGSAPCPCANNSGFGTYSGCANSLGYGSILRGHNISSVSCDTLKMHALLLPSSAFVLFFHGTSQVAGGVGAPFGDGLRCVGGSVRRLATKQASSGACFYPDVGETKITTLIGVSTPGYVSYFQAWYRNPAAFCTASTFNLTNGSAVTWVP